MSHLNVSRKAVLAVIFMLFFSALPTFVVANDTYGVVTTRKDPLSIRSQPNTKSVVITTVKKGSRLQILGKAGRNKWYKVRLSDSTVGYASRRYIAVSIPREPQKRSLSESHDSPLEENRCWEDFSGWGDFKRYSYVTRIPSPKGFLVLRSPTRDAADVITLKKETSASVIGHLEEEGDEFYLTMYSCDQYKKGNDPNWIYVIE